MVWVIYPGDVPENSRLPEPENWIAVPGSHYPGRVSEAINTDSLRTPGKSMVVGKNATITSPTQANPVQSMWKCDIYQRIEVHC
jgi:hypothetical protein